MVAIRLKDTQIPELLWSLCLVCVSIAVISTSCARPQHASNKYTQKYKFMLGEPYRALLEYVQERESGDSFAIVTIELSNVEIESRLRTSFTSELFTIDGREYRPADLKGKLLVWQVGKKVVIPLPDGFSFDTAKKQVRQILDELNRVEVDE